MKRLSTVENIMISGRRILAKLSLLTAVAVIFMTGISHAQPIADSPCDVDGYFESLKARAWLEAQREITQNQNLIFKPDSVLEYTCFDKFLDELATHAQNPMFSETTRWGSILPNDSMDTALQDLVGFALIAYMNGSFLHTYLGGRLGPGYNDDIDAIDGGSYGCDHMNEVWEKAKCMSFVQAGGDGYVSAEGEDGFFTFAEYMADPDKRFLPDRCDPPISGDWEDNINIATVNDQTPWEEDDVVTFLGLFSPEECDDITPIETGILIRRPKQTPVEYREKVCVAPKCIYVPDGLDSGDCQPVFPP